MMIREMFADDINRKQKAFENAMAAIILGIMMYVVAVLLRKGGFADYDG